jgi:mannosyltransferase
LDVQNELIILTAGVYGKMNHKANWRPRTVLVGCLLIAFALRMYRLGQQPLAWDEGWSIGLSSLSWSEISRITALDVHPPLYYYLFRLWLGLGRTELVMRFLSVVAGIITLPLAYVTGKAWARSFNPEQAEGIGLWAACIAAISPFLLYYAQVARMYALCAALSLLATYCLLSAARTGRIGLYVGFVLSAIAGLYTFYYTAFVLAAVGIYVSLTQPRRRLQLLAAGAVVALCYAPWLLYALPSMWLRVGARTGMAFQLTDVGRFFADGVFGLVFAYEAGWPAVWAVAALIAGAAVLAWPRRRPLRGLLLPILAVLLTIMAVSVGAKAHMFAARYLIAGSPFLALLLAWSLDLCWRRAPWLGLLAWVILVASALPTLLGYVYQKSYEVSGSFDPGVDYRYLQGKTSPDDLVVFNVLSLAGLYERYRAPGDARWSYVLRWDPVIEPLDVAIVDRVLPSTRQHRRLWFVLYKGTVAANQPLKQWLDLNLFPAFGQWREDTLYMQYLSPVEETVQVEAGLTFGQAIELQTASFNPVAIADDRVTVRLIWTAVQSITGNYKVFVHLYSADGRLVAQHDAVPVNDLRPTSSWRPGEMITDNHGLWLPAGMAGPLRLVVGIYDPVDGKRLMLSDGSDYAEIGTVQVGPTARQ